MTKLIYNYLSTIDIKDTNWNDLIIELVSIFNLPRNHVKYITKKFLSDKLSLKEVKKFIRYKKSLSAGYIYAPYIPINITPQVVGSINPSILSRYTTCVINNFL